MLDRPATADRPTPTVRFAQSSTLDRLLAGAAGDAIWLLARCLVGGIFVQSGLGKLMALDAFAASLAKNGVPMADVMAVIGAVVEFGGGLAVIIGLQTRLAALLMV